MNTKESGNHASPGTLQDEGMIEQKSELQESHHVTARYMQDLQRAMHEGNA